MKTSPLLRPTAALALALFTFSAQDGRACACCSDDGAYSLTTDNITAYHFTQLGGMEFGPKARLFLTDAGDDQVKGISTVAEEYAATVKLDKKRWGLKFRAEDGKTGSLTLTVPTKVTDFDVDIHDGKKSTGNGPLLYKEWRMEGAVTGDGIFHKAKARYTLVFQGRGNRCDNGNDFTHWRLAVTGKNIDYSLRGELVPEKDETVDAEPDPAAEPEPGVKADSATKPADEGKKERK
jgi:hypothetical protein